MFFRKIQGFILCITLLISFVLTGCLSQSAKAEDGIMTIDQIKTFETLYGKDQAEVLTDLGIPKDDISDGPARGMWSLNKTTTIHGKDFTQILLYDASSETLYGKWYLYRSDNETEMTELTLNLFKDCSQLYGEPSTYPGLVNRISADSFSKDFSNTWSQGQISEWYDEWTVDDATTVTLRVSTLVNDGQTAGVIYLQYASSGMY